MSFTVFSRVLRKGAWRHIREHRYSIVHNHLAVFAALPVWVARRQRMPVITSFANTDLSSEQSWANRPVVRQLIAAYTYASVRYAVSKSTFVTGWSSGVLNAIVPDHRSRPNCMVLHSGVPSNTEASPNERAALHAELRLPVDTPLILHAGRFVPQKNHRGLLDVFEKVLASIPNARLLLAGTGPLFSEVEDDVRRRNLQTRVLLLGIRNDIARLMRCSDVFLLPSFFEGLPMVGLEALSSSLPIVASDIPGVRDEVVRNGETGFIHPLNDFTGMATSVVRVITDAALARQIGRAGHVFAESNYSLEAAASRYVGLYESCLGRASDQANNSGCPAGKTAATLGRMRD